MLKVCRHGTNQTRNYRQTIQQAAKGQEVTEDRQTLEEQMDLSMEATKR